MAAPRAEQPFLWVCQCIRRPVSGTQDETAGECSQSGGGCHWPVSAFRTS